MKAQSPKPADSSTQDPVSNATIALLVSAILILGISLWILVAVRFRT